MIDFHTHILPGIDDGSRDIEMTSAMLEREREMGVDKIIATPHFYAHRMGIEEFISNREEAAATLGSLPGYGDYLPAIKLGAEVYYFQGMGRADKLSQLAVEGTDTLLIEMPFCQWDDQIYKDIYDIIYRRDMTVVLAHIERYFEFQKKKAIFKEILEMPLVLQINSASFSGERKRVKFCDKIVKSGYDIIVGSDCHNITSRIPNLNLAEAHISKKFGTSRFEEMQGLSYRLIGL